MISFKMVREYDLLSYSRKSEWIRDVKSDIATRRENLAADIKAGYKMNSVVRQLLEIEDLEETISFLKENFHA